MSIKLFDVHTHVQFAAFSGDEDEVIRRALEAGVWMVNVGTQKDTSRAAVEAARRYEEGVYAAAGLHPVHTEKSFHDKEELGISDQESGGEFMSRAEEFDYAYYKQLAEDPKTVAIGECGLDYYRSRESRTKQERAFRSQIELALEVRKPLMIHCRNAFEDLIKILSSYLALRDSASAGIVHFFSGTKEDAKKLMDLGFSFSFGGVITFTRDYNETVRHVPLERIVLETDAPYITPVPYRGKRNEPAYVVETAKKMAEIKNVPLEEIAGRTFENACRIFGVKSG